MTNVDKLPCKCTHAVGHLISEPIHRMKMDNNHLPATSTLHSSVKPLKTLYSACRSDGNLYGKFDCHVTSCGHSAAIRTTPLACAENMACKAYTPSPTLPAHGG